MQQVIYRYGLLSWVWRVLIALFLVAAAGCMIIGITRIEPWLWLMSLVLAAPALFFGAVVAVTIERLDQGEILVINLLGLRRPIARDRVGQSKRLESYESDSGTLYAPRCWVPISQGLPVYVDLLGHIPDRAALASALRLPPNSIR